MHVAEGDARRSEAASPHWEPLAQAMGQLVSQGIVLLDRAGRFVWMNEAALQMHGLAWPSVRDVREYEERFDFREADDLTPASSPFRRVLRGETVAGAEYRVLARDGPSWRCRVRASPTWSADGLMAGAVAVLEDVTDRHRMDEERMALYARERLARTAAERERDFIHRIFEAAPIPILVLEGPEHRLAFLNRAAADATGLRDAVGRTHAEILPEDHARVEPLLARVYRGAEPEARAEGDHRFPAGTLALQSHYVPLPGPDRRPIGVVWLAADVTARRRAEQQLESARRRLSQSERLSALGAMVSGIAHELRTPLTSIVSNVSLAKAGLQGEAPPGRDLARHLDEAMEGADRINRLVRELRRFWQTRPTLVSAGLDEVVRPAVDLFRATHVGPLTVVADLRPTPPIRVDAYQMQQVVLNLLQNAADAMPEGGSVRVATRDVDGRARLAVSDRGHGIPEEARPFVFDEFFTTKVSGSGLGLSIARRIVQVHGGAIWFETSAGGTTFHVDLPAAGPGAG